MKELFSLELINFFICSLILILVSPIITISLIMGYSFTTITNLLLLISIEISSKKFVE